MVDFKEAKKKSLKERAAELSKPIETMQDREKGDVNSLVGSEVHINNFDFLTGDDGEYVVFTVKEDDSMFFFGGIVLTEKMKQLDKEGYKEDIKAEGLRVSFELKRNKENKKTYMNVEFPE